MEPGASDSEHPSVQEPIMRQGRYPYQLTPYDTDKDTRGMWQEFAEVLPRL